jgi:hypothetical protein
MISCHRLGWRSLYGPLRGFAASLKDLELHRDLTRFGTTHFRFWSTSVTGPSGGEADGSVQWHHEDCSQRRLVVSDTRTTSRASLPHSQTAYLALEYGTFPAKRRQPRAISPSRSRWSWQRQWGISGELYVRWQSGAYWAIAAFAALGGLVLLLGVLCGGGKERCVGADERVSSQG